MHQTQDRSRRGKKSSWFLSAASTFLSSSTLHLAVSLSRFGRFFVLFFLWPVGSLLPFVLVLFILVRQKGES